MLWSYDHRGDQSTKKGPLRLTRSPTGRPAVFPAPPQDLKTKKTGWHAAQLARMEFTQNSEHKSQSPGGVNWTKSQLFIAVYSNIFQPSLTSLEPIPQFQSNYHHAWPKHRRSPSQICSRFGLGLPSGFSSPRKIAWSSSSYMCTADLKKNVGCFVWRSQTRIRYVFLSIKLVIKKGDKIGVFESFKAPRFRQSPCLSRGLSACGRPGRQKSSNR